MFSPRHPDYFRLARLRSAVITLEGLIATGKSTAGRSLERYLNQAGVLAKFFPEYCNETLLSQYIGDMPRYAYAFQLFMLGKRIAIYQEAERFAAGGGVAIIDRSILGDMTFARMQHQAGFITDSEWEAYVSIMKQEIQLAPLANVFLDCRAEASLRRVSCRGNPAEVEGYSLEYMQKLKEAYIETLAESREVKHIILDWDEDRLLDEEGLLFDADCRLILEEI